MAKLAVAGRTNREIAETLLVDVRTVEGTLSHVYAKLGVRSRTELAVFFDEKVGPTALVGVPDTNAPCSNPSSVPAAHTHATSVPTSVNPVGWPAAGTHLHE